MYLPCNAFVNHRWIRQRLKPTQVADSKEQPITVPLVDRIEQAAREIQAGKAISIALDDLNVDEVGMSHQRLVTKAITAAHNAGPGAVAVLHGIADVLRRREAADLLRESQAATAIFSARVLTWIPGLAGLIMCVVDPRVRGFLLSNRTGWACVVVAIILNLLARAHMQRIVNAPSRADPITEIVDSICVGLAARGTIHGAIEWAAREGGHESLQNVADILAMGGTFEQAMSSLQTDLGPASAPLIAVIRSHQRDGLPITPTLERIRTFAVMRQEREAESLARRLPVRLSFPLVFLILPSFALVTVVPLIAAAIGSLTTPLS